MSWKRAFSFLEVMSTKGNGAGRFLLFKFTPFVLFVLALYPLMTLYRVGQESSVQDEALFNQSFAQTRQNINGTASLMLANIGFRVGEMVENVVVEVPKRFYLVGRQNVEKDSSRDFWTKALPKIEQWGVIVLAVTALVAMYLVVLPRFNQKFVEVKKV